MRWTGDLYPRMVELRRIKETVGFETAVEAKELEQLVFAHTNFLMENKSEAILLLEQAPGIGNCNTIGYPKWKRRVEAFLAWR